MASSSIGANERFETGSIHWSVSAWLMFLILLVFAMVVVGGATRLTDSGLSITEWQPIVGMIPPMTDYDWQVALQKYRQIPEYQQINKGMSLEAFKFIFWWEWSHRFLGRMIGIAFAIPFVAFLLARMLPSRLALKLTAVFLLGGLQGFVGWYMVQSGLVDRVDVSQYRLALHLGIAALIYIALVWIWLDVRSAGATHRTASPTRPEIRRMAVVILVLTFAQIILGAFVAGMKAGLSHNTWPLMDGLIIPFGLFAMKPWYVNFFENALTVQFNHRLGAYLLVAVAFWHAFRQIKSTDEESLRRGGKVLAVAIILQMVLGIWTLLARVPINLGVAHQAVAFIVLAIAVWHARATLDRRTV